MTAINASGRPPDDIGAAGTDICEAVRADGLTPLWTLCNFVTPEPSSRVNPAMWKYELVRNHLLQAGNLITAEEVERRALIFENSDMCSHRLGLDITVQGPEDRSFRKSLDSHALLDPLLILLDESPNSGQLDLSISVNGLVRQTENTRNHTVGRVRDQRSTL